MTEDIEGRIGFFAPHAETEEKNSTPVKFSTQVAENKWAIKEDNANRNIGNPLDTCTILLQWETLRNCSDATSRCLLERFTRYYLSFRLY